ncbi:hypothetical protein CBS101457_003423 [Exobasidium rhododendri]|nr:hypothetical protein CBS101457_003423 [Exobasidium rhododendri]
MSSMAMSGRAANESGLSSASAGHRSKPYARQPSHPRSQVTSSHQSYGHLASPSAPSPLHTGGQSSAKMNTQGATGHNTPPLAPRYHPRATIIIIGMKGAGKTTLGLIAGRALGKALIDADQSFRALENQSIDTFVQSYGWQAFRQREAAILKDLLTKYPYDSIIACGGGVVELEESRNLLKEARNVMPVVNVLRERKEVLRNLHTLLETQSRPDYGEDEALLLARREPLYRECASHVYVNLTCEDLPCNQSSESTTKTTKVSSVHPLKYKQVGESFLRLFRHILGDARLPVFASSRPVSRPASRGPSPGPSPFTSHSRGSISHLLGSHGPGPDTSTDRYSPSWSSSHLHSGPSLSTSHFPILPKKADPTNRASLLTRRTTAVSLTFPDLTKIEASLVKQIVQGVDAVEVRVDMLACMRPASVAVRSSNPFVEPIIDVDEVALQLETLRKMAPGLPILFTLRSDREGGSFFDDRNRHQRTMVSAYSQSLYFKLLGLAIATGTELVDLEMGWDPDVTRQLLEGRERTKILVSYHDLKGALQWDTEVPLKLYQRAAREFGSGVHLVELVGTASRSRIEQNSHLTSFAAKVNSEAASDRSFSLPPLMALNMHLAGRSSRPFNDVLGFISHPSLPVAAGPGQMSLKETMEILVRFGVYQACHFHIVDVDKGNKLAQAVIKLAFDEFGLPFHLHSWPGAKSLQEYLQQNKDGKEDTIEWQGEVNDDRSSGLLLSSCKLSSQQKHLFDLMDRRYSMHLTLIARVVRAVDILARQDVSPSLLGSEVGRRVPNSLGDVRGPLIGCHTLPSSIYRTLSAHTAPINAPSNKTSALLVVLEAAISGDASEMAAIDVATRSAMFAMAKLGYGEILILEEERGSAEAIKLEVSNLVRFSSNDVLADFPSEQLNQQSEPSRSTFATIDTTQLAEAESKSQEKDFIRKPVAIIVIGGDTKKQALLMQTLWKPKSSSADGNGLILPKETWETRFGGTVLRIPSISAAEFGQNELSGEDAPVDVGTKSGMTWERGGWIHVAPWVLERDRIHRGVVEAWTRRSAPVQSMQTGWASSFQGDERE